MACVEGGAAVLMHVLHGPQPSPPPVRTTSTSGPTTSIYGYVWSRREVAVLVVMGVRADGTKELIAMADGYRESSESWAGL